ncbi:hypothetical protein E2C05_22425, partial [Paracraurococcus ruber]
MPSATLERNLWLTAPMMRGDDVLAVQRRLAALGAQIAQDGLYGQGTKAAVQAFQRAQTLTPDGVVGLATWSKLMDPAGAAAVLPPRLATDLLDVAALAAPHAFVKGGSAWTVGPGGVAVQGGVPSLRPAADEAALVARVFTDYLQALTTVLCKVHVPVELVVATICTESSGRKDARRLEPGADRDNPERTPGSVSLGLMQTLLSTAREALGEPGLRLEELRDPKRSIEAGTKYIWNQARQTRFDPPLVAAAYNAGRLRRNDGPENHWKLLQYPIGTAKHVDRFCRYFNAALAQDAALPPEVPRMRDLLRGGGGAPRAV